MVFPYRLVPEGHRSTVEQNFARMLASGKRDSETIHRDIRFEPKLELVLSRLIAIRTRRPEAGSNTSASPDSSRSRTRNRTVSAPSSIPKRPSYIAEANAPAFPA